MNESFMTNLLRLRYTAPEWAFMAQVRNGTGFTRKVTRTADALAMSLYPSRGLHLHGFEVKVSRSDFVKELKTPEKAEDIARFCSFWWIVAPDTNVAPVEMVPANWGLLVMKGDGLTVAKQATFKESAPLDTPMIASIFRNVAGTMLPIDSLTDWKREVEATARITAEQTWKVQIKCLEDGMKRQAELMKKVEAALGCHISDWDVESATKAIRLAQMLSGKGLHIVDTLAHLIREAESIKPAVEAAKTEFAALKTISL